MPYCCYSNCSHFYDNRIYGFTFSVVPMHNVNADFVWLQLTGIWWLHHSADVRVLSLLMNYIVNWLLQLVGRQVASSVWHFVVCDILYSVLLLNCRCLSVVTVGWWICVSEWWSSSSWVGLIDLQLKSLPAPTLQSSAVFKRFRFCVTDVWYDDCSWIMKMLYTAQQIT